MMSNIIIQTMREKTHSNVNFLNLKTALFDFVFTYSHQRQEQSILVMLFYLANAVIHMLIFLSLPEVSLITLGALLGPVSFYVLTGITVTILLQIVLEIFKKMSMYLLVQMELLVFVVGPLYKLAIVNLMAENKLPEIAGIVLIVASVLLSRVLISTILFQRYRLYSLACSGSYIISCIHNYQTMLIIGYMVSQHSVELIRTTIMLLVSLHTYFIHFKIIQMDNLEWKGLNAINSMHIVFSVVLLLADYISDFLYLYMLAGAVVMLYWFGSIFVLRKNNESKLTNIFMEEEGYESLLDVIDRLKNLTIRRHDSHNTELHNFLVTIISEHKRKCHQPNCQLASRSVSEQLSNKVNKNTKLLTLVVFKKIDELMDLFHKKEIENLDTKFNYLCYLTYSYKNRSKLQAQISEARLYPLNLKQQYLLNSYQRICNSFDNSQAVDFINLDEEFLQFEKVMSSALALMQQFWAQFYEQKVDLTKIRVIADKIFPFKARIDQLFKNALISQNYSSYKMLSLYVKYLRLVLHQEQQALKMEDYVEVLLERLRDTQETQFRTSLIIQESKDAETGIIVISLSDTKLGSIFLMNRLACHLFKYEKEDILGKNVSNIMPKIIGQKHDDILINFLKKKRKTFNTDQRLLFGLDSNDLLFPLQLQLQKASYSINDQFIFIAVVKTEKLKRSPIWCMVDQNGFIAEHTAAFRNIFLNRYRKEKKRCIQEIIPNYFDQQFGEEKSCENFALGIDNEKLGSVEATFEVVPIIVKGQNLGQLVRMSYKKQQQSPDPLSNNSPLTKVLKRMQIDQQLNFYHTMYNHLDNIYEMQKQPSNPMEIKNNLSFTLPYLNYRDLTHSVNQKELKIDYGADIKMLRYINQHFERIDDTSSFHSDVYSDKNKATFQDEIAYMKQKTGNGYDSVIYYPCFKIMSILCLAVVIMLGLIGKMLSQLPVEENAILQNYSLSRQVRFYLPEFIIYSSLYNNNINPSYYLAKADTISTIFLKTIEYAPLYQNQREQIMRIVSSVGDVASTANVENYLTMPSQSYRSPLKYVLLWIFSMVACLLIMVFMLCMLRTFKETLLKVYTVFLSLKEPTIRRIQISCQAMLQNINTADHRSPDSEDILLQIPKNGQDQNQLQKIKHFRVSSSFEDSTYYFKLVCPMLPLLAVSIILLIVGVEHIANYNNLKQQHINLFQILPATSAELMKKVYNLSYNQSMIMNNKFAYYQQNLEIEMVHLQSYTTNYDFMAVLFGDFCDDELLVPASKRSDCQSIENGVLTKGLSPALNYLSEKYNHVSITTAQDQARLSSLIDLQFTYVIPVLFKLVTRVEQMLIGKIKSQCSTLHKLVLVLLFFFIGFYLYLLIYPIRIMDQEIAQTNGMISLVPKEETNNQEFSTLSHQ